MTKFLRFGTYAAVLSISFTAIANHPEQARHDGYNDGAYDGSLEGRDRGERDGASYGFDEGRRAGYAQCAEEESRRHYDHGFSQGYSEGQSVGLIDGGNKGTLDGENSGRQKGAEDGRRRADNEAFQVATPEGTARGQSEAAESDAQSTGNAAGLIQGDEDAFSKAQREDYPRARQAFRDARYAEAIDVENRFSQRTDVQPIAQIIRGRMTEPELLKSVVMLAGFREDGARAVVAPPHTNRNYRPRPRGNYTPLEVQAYNQGYGNGYNAAYNSSYNTSFNSAYHHSYSRGRGHGCRQARDQSYAGDLIRGRRDGHRRGYDQAYQQGYAAAFADAESSAFGPSSQAAYQEHYPRYYDHHFEVARASAYEQRYREIYKAAHAAARQQKFEERYPVYAKQEQDRGTNDERDDFTSRPVRLVSVRLTETMANDVFEPGETLRFEAKLRNFAGRELSASAVRLKAEALDTGRVTFIEGESLLVQSLEAKSLTTVTEALGLVPSEASDGKTVRLRFTVFYEGRACGSETIELRPQFAVQLTEPSLPSLREGMPVEMNLSLSNRASKQTSGPLKLRLTTDANLADVVDPEKTLGAIDPNRTVTETFSLIGRSAEERILLPLSITLNDPAGRRIGLFDRSKQVPMVNDYRVRLRASADGLRQAGVTRVAYRLRNANSRWVQRGLQLTVRIEPNDGVRDSFAIVGPNPQYLAPLEQGEFADFVIPVYSKTENAGGTLWLKVEEDGHMVVEHRVKF